MAFKISAEPTFKARVQIPIAGGEPESVSFTFKHLKTAEIDEFRAWLKTKPSNLEVVERSTVGWELTDEFNRDNIVRLLENHAGAARVILQTYLTELYGARLGN